MATVHLVDASPYIFRAYFSLPPTIQSPTGLQVNAVYGYTEFLIQLLKQGKPTHIAVAFDGSLTTSFRNRIYPEYKAQRALPPEELEAQLEACFQITKAMGMQACIDDEFEADDIIATLAARLLKDNHSAIIVSSDKDMAQLVNDRVILWNFAKGEKYDRNEVIRKFGVQPKQIVDLLALTGDSVDNIPGVPGIGPKTAQALLNKFSNLSDIYQNIAYVDVLNIRGANSIREKLLTNEKLAFLSKQLATLSKKAPCQVDFGFLKYEGAWRDKIDRIFSDLGFTDIKDRIPKWRVDS